MRTAHAALIFMASACSSPASSPPPPPPAPLHCDPPSQQMGFYLWHYVTLTGNCGDVPDRIVVWPPAPEDSGVTCRILSEQISDNNCKDALEFTCTLPDGDVWHYIRILTQLTADGSQLSGEISEDGTGPHIYGGYCSGTYSITMTRQ